MDTITVNIRDLFPLLTVGTQQTLKRLQADGYTLAEAAVGAASLYLLALLWSDDSNLIEITATLTNPSKREAWELHIKLNAKHETET